MHPIKIITRLVLSVILGWYSLLLIAYALEYFGQNAWGWFHTGLPLILFPINSYLSYKALGVLKFFKVSGNVQNSA